MFTPCVGYDTMILILMKEFMMAAKICNAVFNMLSDEVTLIDAIEQVAILFEITTDEVEDAIN